VLAVVVLFSACGHHSKADNPVIDTSSTTATTASGATTTVAAGDVLAQYGFESIRTQLVQNGYQSGDAHAGADGSTVIRLHFQGHDGAGESQALVDGVQPATGAQATRVSGSDLVVARAADAATARRAAAAG